MEENRVSDVFFAINGSMAWLVAVTFASSDGFNEYSWAHAGQCWAVAVCTCPWTLGSISTRFSFIFGPFSLRERDEPEGVGVI